MCDCIKNNPSQTLLESKHVAMLNLNSVKFDSSTTIFLCDSDIGFVLVSYGAWTGNMDAVM